jgi:hypothetical protein
LTDAFDHFDQFQATHAGGGKTKSEIVENYHTAIGGFSIINLLLLPETQQLKGFHLSDEVSHATLPLGKPITSSIYQPLPQDQTETTHTYLRLESLSVTFLLNQ